MILTSLRLTLAYTYTNFIETDVIEPHISSCSTQRNLMFDTSIRF